MSKRAPLPSVADVADTLSAVRRTADVDAVADGRAWYGTGYALMQSLADEAFEATGDAVSVEFVAGVVAAFSQNATWKANLTMARNYLCGRGQNGMASVMAEIDAMENGVHPTEALGALKRPDFWRNLTGDRDAVTCDRWHLRAAFGDRKVALTPEVHALVTEATRKVARKFRETPADCQAVIWCAIRGTGA